MSIISILQISKLKLGYNLFKITQLKSESGRVRKSSVLPVQSQSHFNVIKLWELGLGQPLTNDRCLLLTPLPSEAEGTLWREMPEEDSIIRSLEESERTFTCQVLERLVSHTLSSSPHNKPTYKVPLNRRTHECECNTKLANASEVEIRP